MTSTVPSVERSPEQVRVQGVGSGTMVSLSSRELMTLIGYHQKTCDNLRKRAAEVRARAEARGPLWQREMAMAIHVERLARTHSERAHDLASLL